MEKSDRLEDILSLLTRIIDELESQLIRPEQLDTVVERITRIENLQLAHRSEWREEQAELHKQMQRPVQMAAGLFVGGSLIMVGFLFDSRNDIARVETRAAVNAEQIALMDRRLDARQTNQTAVWARHSDDHMSLADRVARIGEALYDAAADKECD